MLIWPLSSSGSGPALAEEGGGLRPCRAGVGALLVWPGSVCEPYFVFRAPTVRVKLIMVAMLTMIMIT